MRFCEGYGSNTLAGTCGQTCFSQEDDGRVSAGRVFLRVFRGGTYRYRFFYSNIVDSTFADGSQSHANLICGPWKLCGLRCGVCRETPDFSRADIRSWRELTFGGKEEKEVGPAEFFASDPAEITAETGEYLCLELRFRGGQMPYLEEALLPIFREDRGAWKPDRRVPLPFLAGCSRPVKGMIAFLGDSITMGIGTPQNSYLHWAAQAAELLGGDCAWWNLGIGYGRAADAATDGAWLFKAKQADFVSVCFGVNDILQGYSALQIEQNLSRTVSGLKKAGCRVGLFTVPPFDLTGEQEEIRREVNRYLLAEMPDKTEYVFDVGQILGKAPPQENLARFGGHPNPEGCRAFAEAYAAFARSRGLFG